MGFYGFFLGGGIHVLWARFPPRAKEARKKDEGGEEQCDWHRGRRRNGKKRRGRKGGCLRDFPLILFPPSARPRKRQICCREAARLVETAGERRKRHFPAAATTTRRQAGPKPIHFPQLFLESEIASFLLSPIFTPRPKLLQGGGPYFKPPLTHQRLVLLHDLDHPGDVLGGGRLLQD